MDIVVDRAALGRVSTAERVTDVLRENITEGALKPGTRLSEEYLCDRLGVSRNTLREAFRLLSHERLLVHEFNRGVFVRELDVTDVADIYRTRRFLECAAVRDLSGDPDLSRVRAAIDEGQQAAEAGDWLGVGTANMHFHQALIGLTGSVRLDEWMRRLLAEGRLAFHAMGALQKFHEPYLARNREIVSLLSRGAFASAATTLADYLDTAERQLIEAFEARPEDRPASGAP